ncbi:MAG: HAD family hydrolase [Clostridia bacterium]|nr:HAD family hydrolase [Clostridia bacterium]
MQTKVVLFDLDGTLLPMDEDVFVQAYFGGITKRLAEYGYESEKLIGAIWKGTMAMIKNDGNASNETVFWKTFEGVFGENARKDEPYFDAFYRENFDKVKDSCGFNENAKKVIDAVKAKGLKIALATNPIFPAIATQKRIAWAGLSVSDFELVTTYENSRFCKPNLNYYKDVISRLGVSPKECLMVGNDVGEDMVAKNLGAKVFLLTDCIINKTEFSPSDFPHGGFDDLIKFIEELD